MPDRVFEKPEKLATTTPRIAVMIEDEIDYIEKKHVKKVNGARPGFVIYHTNYSLVIDSNISGLTLLES